MVLTNHMDKLTNLNEQTEHPREKKIDLKFEIFVGTLIGFMQSIAVIKPQYYFGQLEPKLPSTAQTRMIFIDISWTAAKFLD